MVLKKNIVAGIIFSSLFFLFCSEDENPLTSATDPNEMYGVWHTAIPRFPNITPDITNVEYEISSDSTFSFSVSYKDLGDTLIVNRGDWSMSGADTISLNGQECTLLDTASQMMVSFEEFYGQNSIPPVIMPVNIESGVWTLTIKDLSPLIDVLVPADFMVTFADIPFEFEKK